MSAKASPIPAPLAAAIDDMEAKASDAATPATALGFRHAAHACRLFKDAGRALDHLRQNAAFYREYSPDKAAAYREAFAIVAARTGATPSAAAFTLAAA